MKKMKPWKRLLVLLMSISMIAGDMCNYTLNVKAAEEGTVEESQATEETAAPAAETTTPQQAGSEAAPQQSTAAPVQSSTQAAVTTTAAATTTGTATTTAAVTTTETTTETTAAAAKEALKFTASCVDEKGNAIEGHSADVLPDFESTLDLSKAESIEGYTYKEARIGDVVVTSVDKKTAKDDKGVEKVSYSYTAKDGTVTEITSDTAVTLVFTKKEVKKTAVKVTGSVVDEYNDAIDEKYTDIDLPDFTDTLTLDNINKAPYKNISGKNKAGADVKYTYVKATIDGNTITALKKEAIASDSTDSTSKSDTAADETKAASDYSYSYTTDGTDWTQIEKDTVIKFVYSDGKKTVYTYEDSSVKVTATLQHAYAVPDDAEFKVTPITSGNAFDAYIDALNAAEKSKDKDKQIVHTADNTLLYDVAFLVYDKDEDGNNVGDAKEYEPADGNVKVSFEFKKNQLADIGAQESKDIDVQHMILSDSAKEKADTTLDAAKQADSSDIKVDDVNINSVSIGDTQRIEYTANSFSAYIITNLADNSNVKIDESKIGSETYDDFLGEAINFGITANSITLNSHMDSNFAAKTYNYGGNITTGAYTNIPGSIVVGSIANELKITSDNAPTYVKCTSADSGKVTKAGSYDPVIVTDTQSNINSYVANIISNSKTFSESVQGNNSILDGKNLPTTGLSDWNHYYIDISKYKDGTFYLSGCDDVWNKVGSMIHITKNPGQTIVFNFSGSTFNPRQMEITQNGTKYDSATSNSSMDTIARTLIFNMPNVTGNVSLTPGTCGTFIMPKADVYIGATTTGWIVCNSITGNNGEWHSVYGNVKNIVSADTVDLVAYKNVDGNAATTSQKFTFNLQEYKDGTFATTTGSASTAVNNGQKVSFTLGKYYAAGTHYYKLTEAASDGYAKNETAYYAKVVVSSVTTKTVSNGTTVNNTTYVPTITVYSDAKMTTKAEGTGIVFNNKTQEKTGSLKIVKATTGGTTPAGTTFTITGPSGFTAKTIKYSDFTNGSYLLENIPLGSYTVTEDTDSAKITSYTLNVTYTNSPATVTAGNTAEVDITNTYTQDKGMIKVTKTLSGGATGSYEFTFVVKTSAGKYVTFSSKSYSGTVTDINDATKLKVESGSSITLTDLPVGTYEVLEVSPEDVGILGWVFTTTGSTTDVNEIAVEKGKTATAALTNAYTPELTSISATKVWDDSDNQDGKRTDVVFHLNKKVGENGQTTVVTGKDKTIAKNATGNELKVEWTDLPVYENGEAITYTVTEDQVTDYKTEITGNASAGFTVTNKYTPGKTSVKVTKIWDDTENQDGKRPTEVYVQLKADGNDSGDPIELTSTNGWTYTWNELAVNKAGKKITYTVVEKDTDKLPEGYTSSVAGNATDGFTITNSYTPITTQVSATKVWDDSDNQDGKRTDVVFHLNKKVGENGQTTVVTGKDKTIAKNATGNDLKVVWTDLPVYENGEAITYTVTEDQVTDYKTEITGNASAGFTVTNKYTPGKTSVKVTKIWDDTENQDGKRPTEVYVQLKADGNDSGDPIELTSTNDWTYTWNELAVNKAGKKITYTVVEKDTDKLPEGYTSSVAGNATDGFTITNSYTPITTQVSATKVWDDSDNQDGKRTEVVFHLNKKVGENGQTTVVTGKDKTIAKNATGNDLKVVWTDLPVYENGEAITYTVTEDQVTDYKTEITGNASAGFTVTNKYTPGKTSVKVTKIWDDTENQDGKRPTEVYVQLKADGNDSGDPIELTSTNDWTYTWNELAVNKAGKKITYTVVEKDTDKLPEGYTSSVAGNATDGFTITNSYTPITTQVSATKVWDDSDNQDGKRTDVVFHLNKKVGENGQTTVVTGKDKTIAKNATGNELKVEWTGLPVYENGEAITYTVTEDQVTDYKTEITGNASAGFTVTNKYTPGKTSVKVTKIWDDTENQDGKRPTEVYVQLKADGNDSGDPIELTSTNDWTYTWNELAVNKAGKKITYTVVEKDTDKLPEGYTSSVAGNATDGFTITNSHTPEKTSISGVKTWVDNDDQDGARPEKITVNLLKNGTQFESQTVTAGNDGKWSYSFNELDKYEDGKEIKYTVSEADVPGYTGKVDGNNITNTHTPVTTDRTVTKTWADNDDNDGLRPGTVTMYLYSDGTYTGKSVELTSKDNWASKTITGLQKYKSGAVKQEIDYKWKEGDITGYTADYVYSTPGTCKVTNTHGDNVTSITVNKNWSDNGDQDGLRAKITEVTVHLLNNGNDTGKSAKLNSSNNWSASFTDLPVKTKGVVNKYSVSEDKVEGYTPEYSGIVSGVITVTNKHTPDKTKRKVTKVWDDSNDQDGIRPGSVTVNLLADGKSTGKSVTLNAADNWTASFDDLDKYANGEEIVYTFTENAFSNSEKYKGAFTKDKDSDPTAWTVTNTHTPDLTEATVSKVWDDNNDNDKVRPGTVVMQLLADNVAVEGKTVKLTSDDNWASKTITGLPKYSGGNQIVYSWQETVPAGYSVTSYKKDATGTNAWTVTNKHDNKTTGISVAKVWSDAKNQDGIQPSSVKVYLYADGVKTDRSAMLNADNGWAASFDDLPINKGGSKITYSVKEENVPDGYKVSYSDLDENNKITVTNTHTPAVVTKTIKKIWDDNNNQDGKQPESVTVHLMADGVDTTKSAVLDKTNGWHTEFRNLQKYSTNGKEIVYSFTEDKVDGYELKVTNNGDAYTATNTHKTEVTERSISKVWDDADNQDNIRPANVKINLIKTVDGKDTVFSSVTLSALNSWTAKFTDLPVYEGGKEITYSFAEAEVPDGYTVNITNDGNAYTATNTHKTETTETSIKKVWDDSNNNDKVRPDSVTMQLLADGKAVDGKTVTLNEDNSWSAKIDGLQKYNKGTEIVYSWQEVNVPDGYSASTSKDATGTNAWTVTNTHGDDLTSITVKKAWDDGNDIDSTRTSEVKVYLYKNGVKTTESRVLSGDNGWTATFDKLPVNENGNKIKYTVVEEQVPAGYAVSYSDLKDNAITVTNKHTPDVVSKTIKKAWDDNDNQDGIRPASVTVHLIADGVDTGKTAVLSVENGWSAKFEGLKKNSAKGTAIVYTFTEDAVTGYKLTSLTSTDGVYTATNTHVPEVTKLSITKAWDDADNQDNVRPASVRINLISTVGTTESTVQSVTLSAGNNWTYVFEDLPVYDNGTKIVYSFKEDAVEGYKLNLTNDGAAYTATNIHTPAVTEASVSKVWDDNNNNDNVRPASVTMQLMANGTAVTGKTVTLDATDNWSGKLDNLPKFSNGTLINYTWKEILTEEQQKNYTPSYSPDKLGTNSWTVTNKHDDKVTSITVNKSWDDDSNNDGFRTKSVTVYLLADGKRTGDKVELSGNNKWTAVFDKLPVNVNGKQVTYTVEEEQVKAYEAPVYSELDNGIITITNTHKPVVVNLKATKSFLGNQLAKINEVDLQLYADGAPVSGGLRQLVTAAAKDSEGYYHWGNNELDAEWNDLPKYKNGQEIKYTVVETNNNNSVYKVLYNGVESENGAEFDEDGSAKVINCEWISLSGQKTWNDQGNTAARPSTIAVTLRQDGKAIQTKVVSAADNWSYTFDHMPKFDEGDGHQYAYTVEETDGNGNAVSGYNASYSADNLNIVNTIQTTSVSVNKVWNDNSNQDGRRPINIQVQLRVNGNNLGDPVVISGTGDTWSYTWNNLPVYYNGSKAVYTVYEVSNPGDYAITYDQNSNPKTITNSYTPGYTSKTVTKIWDDQNNADGTRPAAITVRLYADGNQVRTATLTALNGWVYTFTNLPVKSNGNTITYTISEDPVAGYTTVINGNVITNSHSPETPPQPPINPPETPPATPPVDVLGARRTKTGSSVLGARRAPKTGDNANVGVWAVLMGASAAIAAVWASLRKKLRGDD